MTRVLVQYIAVIWVLYCSLLLLSFVLHALMVLVPFCVLFVLILSLCLVVSLLWTSAFPPCVLTYLQGLSASIVHLVSSVSHVSMFVYLSINVKFIYLCVTHFLFWQPLVLCVSVLFCCIPQVYQVPPPYKVCVSLCVLFRPPLWCESVHPSVCKLVFDKHCLALLLLRFCLFYLLPANKTLILGLLSSVSPASWVHSLPATHPQSTTEGFCLGVCFSTSKHPLGVFVFFVLFCPTKHLENCL